MTDLRKAAQQATPRVDLLAELMDSNEPKTEREHAAVYEIERLRAALAQPAEQEPVAWVVKMPGGYHDCGYDSGVLNKVPHGTMLYTHPPARVPNWIRAIDEELVGTFIGVANVSDTYEVAKKKLGELIDWHVQVAIDPAVNGGCVLVPARVPLTDSELRNISKQQDPVVVLHHNVLAFARAVIAAYESKNGLGGGK